MNLRLSPTQIVFLKSTGILISISFIFSSGLFFLNVGNFIGNILILTALQFILFSFVGQILKTYNLKKVREKEIDKLESLSTLLECAYCKKTNLVIFDPDESERIVFECDHCKNKNLVTMQFTVSQIFEPLEIPKVTGIPTESLKIS